MLHILVVAVSLLNSFDSLLLEDKTQLFECFHFKRLKFLFYPIECRLFGFHEPIFDGLVELIVVFDDVSLV